MIFFLTKLHFFVGLGNWVHWWRLLYTLYTGCDQRSYPEGDMCTIFAFNDLTTLI